MTKHVQFLELLIGPLANQGGGSSATLIDKNVSANGTYNASSDSADGYKKVVVAVQPDLQSKSVTIQQNGETTVSPDSGKDGLSSVGITVDVQPNLQSKSVTIQQNGTTNVEPDQDKDGLSAVAVVVNVPSGMSAADKAKWEAFCADDCVNGEVPADITMLSHGVKRQNTNIATVTAPQVKNIPVSAFYNDTNLTSVSFPEALSIGYGAFFGCSRLATLVAPKVASLVQASAGALQGTAADTFNGLSALTALNLPLLTSVVAGITSKTTGFFKGMGALASVNLHGLVSSDSSLIDGANLAPLTEEDVDLSSLVNVDGYVFLNCPNIESLDFPNLETGGFYKLTGLTSISVPKLTKLYFYGCNSLPLSGITYTKAIVTELAAMPNTLTALNDTDFPAVTTLGSVCNGNTNLTTVSLSLVTTINNTGAFLNCTALTSVNLPELTTISGQSTFKGCDHLTSVNLPKLTTGGQYCFQNCTALTSVNLPKLATVDKLLFGGCTNLATIELGAASLTFASISSAAYGPFYQCSGLQNLVLSGVTSVPSVSSYVISSLPATTNIYVPDSLVSNFKTATGWSARSSYIKKLSDYVPS